MFESIFKVLESIVYLFALILDFVAIIMCFCVAYIVFNEIIKEYRK